MGLQEISEKVKHTAEKLHEMAFYLALKRHPFTDFSDQIKLKKWHGVKYNETSENEIACRNVTFCISESSFEENGKKS